METGLLLRAYSDRCSSFYSVKGYESRYRCDFEDILLEMDLILRPEGTIIIRDGVDVLNDVRRIAGGMRWDIKLMDHEDGPLVPEKIFVAVKQYWVDSAGNSTTDDE